MTALLQKCAYCYRCFL